MDHTAAFYSRPSHVYYGSGFPVFAGSRRQRGGSIFGSIKKFFTPIAKKVGRTLLSQGVGLAKDVATDALAGKNIKDSLLSHGKARAVDLGKSAARQGLGALANMVGQGRRRRRRTSRKRLQRSVHKRPRRASRKRSRPAVSRKRKRRAKSSHKRSAKRRRVSFNF